VAERTAGKTNIRLGVSHANAKAETNRLLDLATRQLNPVETIVAELNPVIGTHAGPGTIALAYLYDD
jgi:fatty acid-binding protein DegV